MEEVGHADQSEHRVTQGPPTLWARVHSWRPPLLGPVFAGLALVVAVAFSALLVAGRPANATANLGYSGAITQVTVLSFGDPSQANEIVEFVESTDSGLVFSPAFGSGVLTVLDSSGYFRGSVGPLEGPLSPYGDQPAVLMSELLVEQGVSLDGVLEKGVQIAGTFPDGLEIFGERAVVVANLAAGPLRGGEYLFAGAEVSEVQGLLDSLQAGDAWIAGAEFHPPVSIFPYRPLLMSLISVVLAAFLAATGIALSFSVAEQADWIRVGAVLGFVGPTFGPLCGR